MTRPLLDDLKMAAVLLDEASDLLESIDPQLLESLPRYRWPLADEMGGAAGILRDRIAQLTPP